MSPEQRNAVHAAAVEREAGNAELVKRLAVLAERCPYCRAALTMYRMAPVPNLAAALMEVVEVLVEANRKYVAELVDIRWRSAPPVVLEVPDAPQ